MIIVITVSFDIAETMAVDDVIGYKIECSLCFIQCSFDVDTIASRCICDIVDGLSSDFIDCFYCFFFRDGFLIYVQGCFDGGDAMFAFME